jgi:hypothetical protein
VYGNSDYQNLLAILQNYATVISEATKNVIYNSAPLPVLKGVKDPKKLEAASQANGTTPEKDSVAWNADKVIYLEGDHADAKMLQTNEIMNDVEKLLNLYFYLFVQGSETPEFSLGTAVSSSKASTSTQEPILQMKITRKRSEYKEFITQLVQTYIERRLLVSDPLYLAVLNDVPDVSVVFPAIDEDDITTTLEIVKWAWEAGLLSDQTALEMVGSGKIKNVSEEIAKAAKEAAEKLRQQQKDSGATSSRVAAELLKSAGGSGSGN